MQPEISFHGKALLNLYGYLALAYSLFLVGYFVVPNGGDLYKFYSVAVFLPGLFAVKTVFRELRGNGLWYSILAYLVYMLLTSFWSIDFSGKEFFIDSRLAVYIVMFLLVTILISARDQKLFENIIRLICISAGVAALISIALWYTKYPLPRPRLVGIGIIDNQNPSAFVYGFFAVLNLYYALRSRNPWVRTAFSFLCIALLTFVYLTESNTGILATVTSVSLLLALYKHNHRLLVAASILGAVTAILYLLWSLGLLSDPTDSGFSERLRVWQLVLNQWLEAPVFGNGYQSEILLTPSGGKDVANWAHNALLATLRDGGVTGLILHLLILATATRAALRLARKYGDPIYLILIVFGFICMTADTDLLITRPRELWIIFWLPLAMILARGQVSASDFFYRKAA
ncbi:MAG: O-antigen ligase family protein [Gammaproteobacteria bacterium]|nr:MAG: O-antigen ligase family protein [Gammaproteobacteria bacterium]